MSATQTPAAAARLLKAGDVAAVFGVHERTVARWADRGLLRRVCVGGVTRYSQHDIDRLISSTTNERPAGNGALVTTATAGGVGGDVPGS